MRGAFGKPQGTVARVHIGQVIMSVRTKTQNKEHVVEALRRAKFKFPGRQKVSEGGCVCSSLLLVCEGCSHGGVCPELEMNVATAADPHPHLQIHISKKYGFTKFNACDFDDMMAEKRLIPDGCGVKYIPSKGPLSRWKALHAN